MLEQRPHACRGLPVASLSATSLGKRSRWSADSPMLDATLPSMTRMAAERATYGLPYWGGGVGVLTALTAPLSTISGP